MVDGILILLMLVFAISGYRQGFVIGALSFGGFFSGALIGLQVGPLIARNFDDGVVRIVDRAKELIITGGFNVAPTEVEQVLTTHPDIADAAVVGMPGESGGEEVVAAVVLKEGAELDAAGIREFCRGTLTPYKIPRRFVRLEELPRNLIGKVLRREVRERLLKDAAAKVE